MSFNLFDLLHYQALMTRLLETDSWGRAAYYLSNRWPQQSPAAQTGGQQPARENCNCRIREQCPLDGKCLKSAVIYQAAVTANDNMHQETYIGLTETSFKTRYNNHKVTFRNEAKKSSTELSNYTWSLVNNGKSYSMK